MSFVVVEFEEIADGGLGIVRQSWITPRKKEVFWPPYKQTHLYTKALKQDEPVTYDTWKCCKIKRYFYETDDFAVASSKLRRAEYTSDLQSDMDDSQSRKKRKPRKFITSSSEDEDTSIERPPAIKRSNKENYKETVVNISPNTSFITEPPLTPSSELSLTPRSAYSSTFTLDKTPPSNTDKKDEKLFSLLYIIKEQNAQILNLLDTNKQESNVQLPDNLFPSFPISSDEDLQNLEEKLKDKENLRILIQHLERLGGKDIVTKTNRTQDILYLMNFYPTIIFMARGIIRKHLMNLY